MKKNVASLIPRKSCDIDILSFNESKEDYLLVNDKFGYRAIVDVKTINVLQYVDGKLTLSEILLLYNQKYNSDITMDVIYNLIYNKLTKIGVILADDFSLEKRKVESYLILSFVLINEKALNKISRFLKPIINTRFFYGILFLFMLSIGIVLYSNNQEIMKSLSSLQLMDWTLLLFVNGIILFFHEFGHAAAATKYGSKPGAIGFGFYLVSPVLYADVSDIWKLNKNKRIVINLAGVYMELMFGIMFIIAFYLSKNYYLLICCYLIVFRVLGNLNPFLRYDGYWILSDFTNTPNLRKVSLNHTWRFVLRIIGRTQGKFTKKELFLVLYGLMSVLLIFLVLIFIIIIDPIGVISFPKEIVVGVKKIINGEQDFRINYMTKYIFPLIFYVIILKFLVGLFSKHLQRK